MDNLRTTKTIKTNRRRMNQRGRVDEEISPEIQRKALQRQDVRANIWCAVLAVRLPVVIGVIVWLGPEVLLSLLPRNNPTLYDKAISIYILARS